MGPVADEGGPAAQLSIDARVDSSGAPLIALDGELDSSNADALETALDPIMRAGPDHVIFDLGGLRFMDSAGIAVLVGTAARVSTVSLRRPADVVRRVVELTGLSDVLRIES